MATEKITVPTFERVDDKKHDGKDLTALEQFIWDNCPAGYISEKEFMDGLQAVLDEVLEESGYKELCERVDKINPEAAKWMLEEAPKAKLQNGFAPYEDLYKCFVWDETPQGWAYWRAIDTALKEQINNLGVELHQEISKRIAAIDYAKGLELEVKELKEKLEAYQVEPTGKELVGKMCHLSKDGFVFKVCAIVANYDSDKLTYWTAQGNEYKLARKC